jgi:hypothetical protein
LMLVLLCRSNSRYIPFMSQQQNSKNYTPNGTGPYN